MIEGAVRRSRVRLGAAEIDCVDLDGAVAEILRLAAGQRGALVVTPNVDHLVRLENDDQLRLAYREAALVLADGVPLTWLARAKGTPLRGRVNGTDVAMRVIEAAEAAGLSVGIVGGRPEVSRAAIRAVRSRHPNLLVGGFSPEIGFEEDPARFEAVITSALDLNADVLLACLGAPRQEQLALELTSAGFQGVVLCVGSAVDFIAGAVPRAPRWMQRAGLEWAFRLSREPRRLWKRYLVDDIRFVPLAIRELRRGER